MSPFMVYTWGMHQMTGHELKEERMKRGMTYAAFGEWLAARINRDKPEDQQVRPYTRQRVYEWESGAKDVPDKIEVVILRERLEHLMAEPQRVAPKAPVRDPDREREER